MTSTVTYLGELRTKAVHTLSGETIITDAPPDNQGLGQAFSPTDMCATSLASCMLTIMGISARNHGLDITGTTVEVTKIMASDPRRIARIDLRIIMPKHGFSETDRKILEKAGRTCPVALSLHPDLVQVMDFEW